jgi:hypothetical protein
MDADIADNGIGVEQNKWELGFVIGTSVDGFMF